LEYRSTLTADAQLAAVEQQIAAIKAQLDADPGDDPALWPLRKKLVSLWSKHRWSSFSRSHRGIRARSKRDEEVDVGEKGQSRRPAR
jgi:hypothetical protein